MIILIAAVVAVAAAVWATYHSAQAQKIRDIVLLDAHNVLAQIEAKLSPPK
jgi:sensor domain CHASE-containing protein